MLDVHAVLHAVSHLLECSTEPVAGMDAILVDAARRLSLEGLVGGPVPTRAGRRPLVPRADLAELLLAHDELGRTASSGLIGEIALTAGIVERVMGSRRAGVAVPVQAIAGSEPLKVERSRPDWHLNGTARGVAWTPDVRLLAVFAIDEGDNDVLALVEVDAAQIARAVSRSAGSGRELVDIRFDDVPLPEVAHCPGEPSALADALAVLAMADVIGSAGWLLDPSRGGAVQADALRRQTELRLCRATLRAAAASLTSSTVRRQHDVSAAALLVLPTCLRLAETAPDHDDPEVARRVQRIREQVLDLPQWHRDRLLALV